MLVHNAVGVITTGQRTLEVRSKIPQTHYLFLLQEGQILPRMADLPVGVQEGHSLWELVARWYLQALREVLRADLIRDYRSRREVLQLVRGRLNPLPTAREFARGRIALDCTFEEFDTDNALNRVLRAAARAVAANRLLPLSVRKEAVLYAHQLDGIGDLVPSDLEVQLDLRTDFYRDALILARHVLTRQGRTLQGGTAPAWAFLLSSPLAIEAGVRAILSRGMQGTCTVTRAKRLLPPSQWSLNPDLVFGHEEATGDVKYTNLRGEWQREHIYQATTFATGFRCTDALVVGFRDRQLTQCPAPLDVGDVHISQIAWLADEHTPPQESAQALVRDCNSWFRSAKASGKKSTGGCRYKGLPDPQPHSSAFH